MLTIDLKPFNISTTEEFIQPEVLPTYSTKVVSRVDVELKSPHLKQGDIPHVYIVRAVTKSGPNPDSLCVRVIFPKSDVFTGVNMSLYVTANHLVMDELPGYWIVRQDDWYVKNETVLDF
ncbi:MAG: hypothetical protein F6K42_14925 [Leptolyngbya sp. SIO1D8]|nr:hypothetical protein [Leptolyngbya sp. SIO1D8]